MDTTTDTPAEQLRAEIPDLRAARFTNTPSEQSAQVVRRVLGAQAVGVPASAFQSSI